MKYFNYSKSPELKKIQEYFTEEEWKQFCQGLHAYDKEEGIDVCTAKDWIKDLDWDSPVLFYKVIEDLFYCYKGVDESLQQTILARHKLKRSFHDN